MNARWAAPLGLLSACLVAIVAAMAVKGCGTGQGRADVGGGAGADRGRTARVRQPTSARASLVLERRAMIVREVEPPLHVVHQCEPGQRRPFPLPRAHGSAPLYDYCIELADGSTRWPIVNTPLVVVFDDARVQFTRVETGAVFHIGLDNHTEWVSAATPWLALDRDGSGCIESERELFAGFDVLAELDDNGDGRIDARDPAFGELVLWADRDQDKVCGAEELTPLGFPIDLAHTEKSPLARSYEGETAMLPTRPGRIVDVYLAPARGSDRSDFEGR